MFNFYVVLAGQGMVTDRAEIPRAGANSKPHHYKQKVQNKKDLPKVWVLTGIQFEDFRQKKNTNFILDLSKNLSRTPRP